MDAQALDDREVVEEGTTARGRPRCGGPGDHRQDDRDAPGRAGPSSPWNKVAGGLTAVEGARI